MSTGSPPFHPAERAFPVLPTLLTLGNAFCGFASITYAAKVGPEAAEAAGGHLFAAAIWIFLAMFFDVLDGSVARWTNQTSEFGSQLDSLCDVVSFGLAPAFLMLQFSGEYHPRVVWVAALLYLLCAVLRLARFNLETEEQASSEFSGLPSPAAAGVLASFPIAMLGPLRLVDPENPEVSRMAKALCQFLQGVGGDLLPPLTVILACLMISRIRYVHIFQHFLSGRRNYTHVIRLVFAIAVIFIVREMALLVLFSLFAFSAPVKSAWRNWIAPRLPFRSAAPLS